jgi:hypothetical protein
MVPQVILYNQSAEAFHIFEEDWRELCETAKRHGWQPAGTARPPISLDIDSSEHVPEEPWNQEYRVPQQQTVMRHDARALAAALRHVDEPVQVTLREAFINYCERGSFMLCPEPQMALDAPEQSVREAEEPALRKARILQTAPFLP